MPEPARQGSISPRLGMVAAALLRLCTLDDALRHALRHAGRSIAFNVAVFSAGFLVLLLSDYSPSLTWAAWWRWRC